MGRTIRWQALVALLGIVLLAAILASTAREFTNLTVPARGGVYTEAVVGAPRAINPLLSLGSDLDSDLTGLLFQGLVALNERGEPIPALAESWEISPDQKDITFRLRRDVRASAYLSQLWRNVSVEQVDPYTVRFRLQQPLASFLAETTIGILPSHLWNRVPVADLSQSLLNLQPVGTGPWRLASLSAQGARLEPNPYETGPMPYLEAIEFRFYPDYASAFAAFQAGEVDGVSRVTAQDMLVAQESEAMQVLTAPLAGATYVYFNQDSAQAPFLADVRVRQALHLALDQPQMIDGVLNGQGIPADGPFMPGAWAYTPGEPAAADANRAIDLLTEAGWTDTNRDGVRDREGVDLAFELLGDNEALLQELADQWRQIGVRAEPKLVNLASLAGDYLSPRTFQAAVTHWQLSGDPDPYPLWHSTQIDNGQNYTGWSNEQADLLLEQGRSVNDPGLRMQLYGEFQRIFREELPALPLYYDVYAYGVSDQVKDVEIGRLNWPWERFRSAGQWYIVTQRVTVEE